MKKPLQLILISLSFFAFSNSNAQPTLTSGNFLPHTGEDFNFYTIDEIPAGSAGANVTWDFSTVFWGGEAPESYVSISSTPYGNYFSSSNLASSISSYGLNNYFKTSSSAYAFTGYFYLSYNSLMLSNFKDHLRFPFTYNSSFTDTYAGTYESGVSTSGTISGSITVTADGYGTLIMPYGVVYDVLRVKSVDTYVMDTPTGPQNYSKTGYAWYKEGVHYPVMNIETNVIGMFSNSMPFILDPVYVPFSGTGVEGTTKNHFTIYPNPSNDLSTIIFSQPLTEQTFVTITNAFGEVVKTESLSSGLSNYTLNIAGLSPGIYVVKAENGKELSFSKIIRY